MSLLDDVDAQPQPTAARFPRRNVADKLNVQNRTRWRVADRAVLRFEDFRGEYVEIYNEAIYQAAGITVDFIEDISVSTRHVLRGIHGDASTAKLVSCLYGKFYLVVVNNDPASAQYRKWTSCALAMTAFFMQPLAMVIWCCHDRAIFHYKQSAYYDRTGQFTLLWNDPQIGVWWPISDPIVSRRDAMLD